MNQNAHMKWYDENVIRKMRRVEYEGEKKKREDEY
jgi:hypothetical protein